MSTKLSEPGFPDKNLSRIKSRIDLISNVFKQGKFSILVNLFVSFMVTLEISNGKEKINIQEILKEFISRLNKLEQMYQEYYNILQQKDVNKEQEFKEFREGAYSLFDLGDIFRVVLSKCVTFGKNIDTKYYIDYIKQYTKMTVDSILFTDTDEEFNQTIIGYITERISSEGIQKKELVKEYLKKLVVDLDKL